MLDNLNSITILDLHTRRSIGSQGIRFEPLRNQENFKLRDKGNTRFL